MGHKDFTMLVEVYAKWMDDESPNELQNIWRNMQTPFENAPILPHAELETSASH